MFSEYKKQFPNVQILVDRSYGARPLRRAIQRYIEDPLSEALIRGDLKSGRIEIYLDHGALSWRPVGEASGHRLAATV